MRDYLSEKHRNDLDAASRCVGLVLSGVARSQYVFDGEPDNDHFGELELCFHNGPTVTLHLASDAESVRLSVRQMRLPEPFDIDSSGNGRCEWERVDLTSEVPWAELIDQRVAAVDPLIDGRFGKPGYEFLTGWRFRFALANSFVYFNNGDNAAVKWSGFPEPVEGGVIRAVQVAP